MNQTDNSREDRPEEEIAPVPADDAAEQNDGKAHEPAEVRFADKIVPGIKKFGSAAWAYIKHAKIELLVIAGIILLDLVTKALVGKFMYLGQSITVIPQFLYITYVRNTKAAFGSAFGLEKVLGDNAIRIIFLIITLLAMGVFSYILYRCRKRNLLMRLSIAMILAGAFGNFIDRLVLHYVRDFIEIVFFGCNVPLLGKTFPVFNVADMGLTVGVILFLVYFIAFYKEPKKATATEEGGEPTPEENADTVTEESAGTETEKEEHAETDASAAQPSAPGVSENEHTQEGTDTRKEQSGE